MGTVFIVQIIWTATAVLYGGRKTNICGWLREGKVVQTVIVDRALNSIRGGDVYLGNLATDDGCLGC